MSNAPELFLSEKTFVCETEGVLVFLDLQRDKYSCLEQKYTIPIGNLLGLPVSSTRTSDLLGSSIRENSADVAKTVQHLIDSGLATQEPRTGKRAAFVPEYSELREMLGYMPGKGPKVRSHHILNFFKALITTKLMLRFASMERTVMRVKRRKDRFLTLGGAEPPYDRINELVEIYKILKPLFVTVKDECLFNSFFLIEFLASYRVYPDWCFGVRLNDFYAHAWVQGGNVIYDDSIRTTTRNRLIMLV